MPSTRRHFLDTLALGATALGAGAALPATLRALPAEFAAPPVQGEWDTRWPARLTGRVRTVFDVPEIESGYGVWRASVWATQFQRVLGHTPTDLSTALVIRHNAIVLAMQQAFWDRYGIGKSRNVTHPATGQPTDRNPALMGAGDGIEALQVDFALGPFMRRGGIVLACNLALEDLVALVQQADGVSEAEARTRTRAALVPGVILQPSGVFAVLHAQQEAKALYIRAS
ncbi:MAG: hypothetical protein K1X31_09785 [Gemmatimonadaceae bacterium]|nr:hypothetical protein [Gemmatimonadaceae bacterium]